MVAGRGALAFQPDECEDPFKLINRHIELGSVGKVALASSGPFFHLAASGSVDDKTNGWLRRLCQAKELLALGPTVDFSDRA